MKPVGVLGCGMVGKTWLRDLPWAELGLEPLVYDPIVARPPHGARAQNPVELAETHTVLVFAPGHLAAEAVRSMFPAEGHGPTEILDFSSNGPAEKAQLAKWCTERSSAYIDVTILGIVSALGISTPLALAGPPLSEVSQVILRASEAPVSSLADGRAGDAARLKLVRSIVMKGLEALAVEAQQIAEDLHIQEAYQKVYRDVDLSSFTTLLEGMTASHQGHAERRGHEVREVLSMVGSLGYESDLLQAVARNYEQGSFRKPTGESS